MTYSGNQCNHLPPASASPKEFETEDLAVQAVKQLAGVDFHGRKLSVQPFGQARGRLWMNLAALWALFVPVGAREFGDATSTGATREWWIVLMLVRFDEIDEFCGSFLWFVAVLLYPCSITGIVCFTSPFFLGRFWSCAFVGRLMAGKSSLLA